MITLIALFRKQDKITKKISLFYFNCKDKKRTEKNDIEEMKDAILIFLFDASLIKNYSFRTKNLGKEIELTLWNLTRYREGELFSY